MKPTVEVEARWRSSHTFEFETEEEAEKFAEAVNEGDLDAIVKAGDVHSDVAELVDFSAH